MDHKLTRRTAVAGLSLMATPVAVGVGAYNARADEKKTMPEKGKGLYERLGGVFAIAALVEHFSDAVVKNPIVGQDDRQSPWL